MIQIEIQGLARVLKKLSPELIGKPLGDFFKRSAIKMQGEVRSRTPVDTGHLRNAMMYEVDDSAVPLWAKVGPLNGKESSPLWYKARAMEFGTGRQGQQGVAHKAGHWPPSGALELWAKRHGFNSGAAVARIIGKRGGLKPRKMLQEGFKASLGDIRHYLKKLGDDIVARWEKS